MEVQELLKCISCKRSVATIGSTKFLCPSCGQYQIVRCNDCRNKGVAYKCPKCGFEGP